MRVLFQRLFVLLFCLFCFAYPFGVTGIAFDVRPPFSLDWAGSVLLFLEGTLLILATGLVYGSKPALLVGGSVIVLSWLVETLGVNTGFPFGIYHYTAILFPQLPGGVPLSVMFAWVLVVLGSYGWMSRSAGRTRSVPSSEAIHDTGSSRLKSRMDAINKRQWRGGNAIGVRGILLGAVLATLLDFAIEPVAFHVVSYWIWDNPGSINYYGVPLANFVAWFVVALLLLWLTDVVLSNSNRQPLTSSDVTGSAGASAERDEGKYWLAVSDRLIVLAPRILFAASLLMFGLIDLTHGYFLGTCAAVLAGVVLIGLKQSGVRRHY